MQTHSSALPLCGFVLVTADRLEVEASAPPPTAPPAETWPPLLGFFASFQQPGPLQAHEVNDHATTSAIGEGANGFQAFHAKGTSNEAFLRFHTSMYIGKADLGHEAPHMAYLVKEVASAPPATAPPAAFLSDTQPTECPGTSLQI